MKCYFLCKQINRFSCFLSSSFVILGSESPKIRDFIDSRVKLTNPPKKKNVRICGFRTLVCRGVWEMGRSNATVTPSRKAVPYSKKKKNRVNNSLHLWSEEISFVEEWISLDSNSSRVKIHYSTSGISSGSLDIHSKKSDHWRHYPGNDVSDKYREYEPRKPPPTRGTHPTLWKVCATAKVLNNGGLRN